MLGSKESTFIKENLIDLSREIKQWKQTGLLHNGEGGKLRELATMIQDDINNEYGTCLRLAESMVYDYCMEAIIELSE